MPIRYIVTAGTCADCRFAPPLIRGMTAETLLANRGYDTNEILECCTENGIETVIPPKRNCRIQREYDEYLYKIRYLVENAFLKLKQWREIATRYAKKTVLSSVRSRSLPLPF